MERLQQAIQRARQERQGSIGNVPSINERSSDHTANLQNSLPAASTGAIGNGFSSGQNEPVVPLGPIEYSQTRVVQLDEEHIETNRIIAGSSEDERVEAYRQLRAQVLHTLEVNDWSTLAITSPTKDAGKTLTSVNLAISLSKEVNHTVLLVDLDLTQPDVHSVLGVEAEYGLLDVLDGRVGVEQVLFNPDMQRLVVLPCRPTDEYSSEILSSPEMNALMQEMKDRYKNRIIIFDLPPLLRNDDAIKFTPQVDATLMVVEAGRTTPEELERATHLMRNGNLIGTILNKTR